MANLCKYYKQQRFVSYNSGTTWQPLEEYRKGSLIEPDSYDCGAVTSYRWFPSGTTCIGYNKWQQSIYQVSYDNGSTWANVIPFTYSATTLLEQNSEDCGYVPPTPTYRWVNSGYTCVGYDKYQQKIKQVSYDSGATWANVNPPQYSATTLIEANSSYCGYEPPTPTYRWYPSGTTCIEYNKWQQSIYQVSYDNGSTWSNVDPPQYSATTLLEQNSEDCGYIAPVYRWQPSGTTCVGYDKYNRAIKQVSYDSGSTWSNVYPPEYSATTLIKANSEDCGYVPPSPEYRIVSTAFTCVGYDKHYLDEYQVSYNGGETWQTVSSSTGSLIEANSEYCGYVHPTPEYRWVNMDISTDYECDLTAHTKYYRQKKQVSYDGGSTWADVTPPQYQRGSSAETNSVDCGYVPPLYRWVNMDISTNYVCDDCSEPPSYGDKVRLTYARWLVYTVECDGSSVLSSADTKTRSDGDYVYYVTAITSAEIGQCVTELGDCVFSGCTNITSVTIPSSVISIGEYAFTDCSELTSIYLPDSITSIGDVAFNDCSSLKSIKIPSGVTEIGTSTFGGCSGLTSITLPSGLIKIDTGAFTGCHRLTSIDMPNSLTTIGDYAFQYCSGLTSVIIPSGVTGIGLYAFQYCLGLTSITCLATTPPHLYANAFDNTNGCPIYVPAESVYDYKHSNNWSGYERRIQAIQ